MTLEEIKRNAPEGATHYHPAQPLYIKLGTRYELFIWFNGNWVKAKSKVKQGIMNGIKPL